ncbi:hypothetical protein PROFUN_04960 [Planoprotostelium fungivorum]|uniref:Uncharacterized protein n=1 Tax=Planoprotostelium fungivorum TaxID=1890364 RepID=A0A2P6NSW5_9EUKA|nr:hypothetical protein PROFUN_04960 [Planoprotostelium fungivorum]
MRDSFINTPVRRLNVPAAVSCGTPVHFTDIGSLPSGVWNAIHPVLSMNNDQTPEKGELLRSLVNEHIQTPDVWSTSGQWVNGESTETNRCVAYIWTIDVQGEECVDLWWPPFPTLVESVSL